MKVLHIISSLDESSGGPARSVPQTCIELAKLGIDIDIIAQPSPKPVFIPEIPNLKVIFYTYFNLIQFAKNLSRSKYDLIHLQHIWTPYISIMAKAARDNGIPYIITPRGMLEPWIMARNSIKKKLAMALYQRNDLKKAALIHSTAVMEAENIRLLGFTNPISIIPNGIDLSNLPSPKSKYGNKKIVFLSRIHPKKGIEFLLDTWRIVQVADWTLEIAGDGDSNYIESIRHKIDSMGLHSVKLVGPKYGTEKWDFLKSADLFVLPTYSENFGIVVAEALAMGVPVITTTGTPWKELVTYQCGWWIDLSIETLRVTIENALQTDAIKLGKMGTRGIELIIKKYDIKAVAMNLYKEYNKLISFKN